VFGRPQDIISTPSHIAPLHAVRHVRALSIALVLGVALVFMPGLTGVALAHALLVRSVPAAGSTVAQAPAVVQLFFSEGLNASLSRAVVLDAHQTSRLINTQPSHTASSTELDIPLPPKLGDGQYLVVWRSVSSDDGHILEDAFCFTVGSPAGAPAPCALPQGNIPGLGASIGGGVTGGALLAALGNWLGLLAALAWVGGLIWQIGVWRLGLGLPETLQTDRGTVLSARRSAIDRFERWLGWLIGGMLAANALLVLGGAVATGAGLGEGVRDILTQSQFGSFWFVREIAALAGLLVIVLIPLRAAPLRGSTQDGGGVMLAGAGGTPVQAGALALPSEGRLLLRDGLALGAGLMALLAVALSGHAASVTGSLASFAVPVDWLHLAATSAWVGGIWYIAAALLPSIRQASPVERGRVLESMLPLFSPIAFTAIGVLTLAGIFNTDVHLTSLSQFVTTGYGLALLVKLILVATMLVLSAWHVWRVRPRLSRALARNRATAAAGERVQALVTRLEGLLRAEAALGVGVVACVAVMGLLGGSLNTLHSTGGQPIVLKQNTAGGYSIQLAIAPVQIGTSTATVTVKDASGRVVEGAVSIDSTMLDMPMGTQTNALAFSRDTSDYDGTVEFLMAGRWQLAVHVTPKSGSSETATFIIQVSS
jgi:copper transport protein